MQISGLEVNQNLNPALRTKTGILNLQIVKIQSEHMVNRVSSYFPKVTHSATKTEHSLDETLTPKTDNRKLQKTNALELMNYWGALTSFKCITSPSVSEVVQNI